MDVETALNTIWNYLDAIGTYEFEYWDTTDREKALEALNIVNKELRTLWINLHMFYS